MVIEITEVEQKCADRFGANLRGFFLVATPSVREDRLGRVYNIIQADRYRLLKNSDQYVHCKAFAWEKTWAQARVLRQALELL